LHKEALFMVVFVLWTWTFSDLGCVTAVESLVNLKRSVSEVQQSLICAVAEQLLLYQWHLSGLGIGECILVSSVSWCSKERVFNFVPLFSQVH